MKRPFLILTLAITILFSFLSVNSIKAQFPTDSARIYLLTASPGTELYSVFGHSAIEIVDKTHDVDFVYNYGTFDFKTPHFYEKFVFGRLLYSLSIARTDDFIHEYLESGQAVFQQALNLTNAEKWKLIKSLEDNYMPSNRYYRYDFLYDDCSTRIRDIIEKSVDSKLGYSNISALKNYSFRRLLDAKIKTDLWITLGFDLMLGPSADKIADTREFMFLPDHLMNILGDASIQKNGSIRRITQPYLQIMPNTIIKQTTSFYFSPIFIFSILLILVITFSISGYNKKNYWRTFDIILFVLTGLLGILFIVLWYGSLHKVLCQNMNLLWANPLNLIIMVGLIINRNAKWFKYALYITGCFVIVFIPVSFVLTQHFPLISYILDLIILIRFIRIYKAIDKGMY